MKLTETACLGPLMTKHGPEIEIFLRNGNRGTIVLDIGSDCPGGPFRSQGQRGTVSVLECVHFLLNNIGRGTDAPRKQGRHFKDRNANFMKSIPGRPSPGGLFDEAPTGRLLRQQIFDTFDALDYGHRIISLRMRVSYDTGRADYNGGFCGKSTDQRLAPYRRERYSLRLMVQ